MNQEMILAQWKQLRGKAKEKFGQLTDDDLLKADGSIDQMIGKLQERYGYSKEKAQTEWNMFVAQHADNSATSASANGSGANGSGANGSGANGSGANGSGANGSGANGSGANGSGATGASGAVNAAKGIFESVNEQVQKVAADVVEQGKQAFGESFETVSQRADSLATEQQQRAASTLQGVASALRSTEQDLRHNEYETFADYASAASTYVEDFSTYLRNRNPLELWGEAKSFAQRQPEVFVLGSLAAGFLLGRFLRSSDTASAAPRVPTSQRPGSPRAANLGPNAPREQQILVGGAPHGLRQEEYKVAAAAGNQIYSQPAVTTPATLATPTRPEDRPQAASASYTQHGDR